ncbi:MAG: YqiA/YcfP family alpha/beta fold hydrolase [Limnohabitans sp.]
MPLPPTHLLYLHGFRSSPQSFKARRMAQAVAGLAHPPHWWCPQLPASPQQAMALIAHGIARWPTERMAVLGSSLGGFYAHVLARQIGCPLVLLNPAVHPARDLAAHIGEHPAWHDPEQRIHFDARFIDELRALEGTPRSAQPPTLALIAKGDEVLDWREMQAAYGHDQLRLIEGSDHALSDFDLYLPEVLGFLGWQT